MYQGRERSMNIPIPFLFGPQRAWKSFSDPKRVHVKKTSKNTHPLPKPEKRNLWNFRREKPRFLNYRCHKSRNPNSNSEHGSGKNTPRSLGKNRQLRQDIESLDKERQNKERRYIDIYDYIRNSGSTKREIQWWE